MASLMIIRQSRVIEEKYRIVRGSFRSSAPRWRIGFWPGFKWANPVKDSSEPQQNYILQEGAQNFLLSEFYRFCQYSLRPILAHAKPSYL